jgi:GTPase SAR1 family protein
MNGVILVFDVTKRTSFDHIQYWLQNIKEKSDPNIQILLLGHKSDVTRREVRYEEGQQLALHEHITYA